MKKFIVAVVFACHAMSAFAQDGADAYGQADKMFQVAQAVQTSRAARAVQQIALRIAAREAGAQDLAIARRDLTQEREHIQADPDLDPTTRRLRLNELDVAIRANGLDLAEAFPGYNDIIAPVPLTVAQVQAALDPDEALILLHQAPQNLFIWVMGRDLLLWQRVPATSGDAADLVGRFRQEMGLDGGVLRGAAALDDDVDDGADDPHEVTLRRGFNTSLAHNIHQLIFGPYWDQLQTINHLRIVPDAAWIGLPFAALLTDVEDTIENPTARDLRDASWVARTHAITLMPSVVSLLAVKSTAADPESLPTPTLLALGDPVFQGTSSAAEVARSGDGKIDITALAPLPGTRREVRAIAATFAPDQAQVLLGAQASETALNAIDLSTQDVIVFATHGLISGELQGLDEPALALTPPHEPTPGDDGLLKAGEIAGLTLNAEWVVLSACNTAAGDGEGAEGLSGLASAFFAAGAEALLVSHWPVRDDAAARLTAGAFAQMRETPDLRKAEALRRSMLTLLEDDSDPTLAHPFAWAPFFMVGNS